MSQRKVTPFPFKICITGECRRIQLKLGRRFEHYSLTAHLSQGTSELARHPSNLIWATLLGYLIWLDVPSLQVWFGAVIIISSGLYVIYRESLHREVH